MISKRILLSLKWNEGDFRYTELEGTSMFLKKRFFFLDFFGVPFQVVGISEGCCGQVVDSLDCSTLVRRGVPGRPGLI